MATNVGKLAVVITASSKQFSAGMDQASAKTKQFGSGLTAGGVALAGFAAAAAAGYAAVQIFEKGLSVTLQTMQQMDALAKKSRALDLTGQQFSEMTTAAERAGVSSEEFGKGLQRLMKNASDARNGLSTAVRAFDQLGISAQEVRNLSPDQLLGRIADGIQGVGSTQERVRVAMDLFGRSGVKMLNLMSGGAEGWQKALEKARGLGIIDQTALENAERANDAMADLKKSFDIIKMNVVGELAPAFEELAYAATAFVSDNNGFFDDLITGATLFTESLKLVINNVDELGRRFEASNIGAIMKIIVDANMLLVPEKVKKSIEQLGTFGRVLREQRQEEAKARRDQSKAGATIGGGASDADIKAGEKVREGLMTEMDKFVAEQDKLYELWRKGAIASNEYRLANEKLEASLSMNVEAEKKREEESKKRQADQDAFMAKGADVFEQTRTESEKFWSQMKELKMLFEGGAIDKDTYQRAQKKLFEGMSKDMGPQSNPAALMRGSAEAWSKSLELQNQGRDNTVVARIQDQTEVLDKRLQRVEEAVKNTKPKVINF